MPHENMGTVDGHEVDLSRVMNQRESLNMIAEAVTDSEGGTVAGYLVGLLDAAERIATALETIARHLGSRD